MERIPVSGPSITAKEIAYVTDAVTTAWYKNANAYNDRFEREFAKFVGVRHAVALPSCTSAIHLSLLALGVGPGDEVVVPECTWIASAAPVNYVGATPVFCDVDEKNWCMSPASLESYITPRTRAIIPVNLYGNVPDMDTLRDVAARHNIAIVEDAAESIGSEYHGKPTGSLGDVGVFSFHGSKTLVTGEGGMLVSNNDALYRRVLVLRDHGRQPGDRFFFNSEVGYKYKMSSMQAALGLAQLERIGELVGRKRQIFSWYREDLGNVAGITLNPEPANTRNSYWMVTALLDDRLNLDKQTLMDLLDKKDIDSRPFFHPLSSLPAYAQMPNIAEFQARNTTSRKISRCGINLPSGLNLTRENVSYVTEVLKSIMPR